MGLAWRKEREREFIVLLLRLRVLKKREWLSEISNG